MATKVPKLVTNRSQVEEITITIWLTLALKLTVNLPLYLWVCHWAVQVCIDCLIYHLLLISALLSLYVPPLSAPPMRKMICATLLLKLFDIPLPISNDWVAVSHYAYSEQDECRERDYQEGWDVDPKRPESGRPGGKRGFLLLRGWSCVSRKSEVLGLWEAIVCGVLARVVIICFLI